MATFRRQIIGLVLGLLASAVVSSAPAGAMPIDDYTTADSVSVSVIGFPATSQRTGGGILGGERDISVELLAGVGTASIDILGGSFSFSRPLGVNAVGGAVWDGMDGSNAVNPAGLGSDFTAGGAHAALLLDIPSASQGAEVALTVWSSATNFSNRTVAFGAGSQRIPVAFSSFTMGGGALGPADFANVGALGLQIQGGLVSAALNVQGGPIATVVPEPSSVALLGLGLLGLATQGRRCRR